MRRVNGQVRDMRRAAKTQPAVPMGVFKAVRRVESISQPLGKTWARRRHLIVSTKHVLHSSIDVRPFCSNRGRCVPSYHIRYYIL